MLEQPGHEQLAGHAVSMLNVPGSSGMYRIVAIQMPNATTQQEQGQTLQLVDSGEGRGALQVVSRSGGAMQLQQPPLQSQQPLQLQGPQASQLTLLGREGATSQPFAVMGPHGQPIFIHPDMLLQQGSSQQQAVQPQVTITGQQAASAGSQHTAAPAAATAVSYALQQALSEQQAQQPRGKWEGSGEVGRQWSDRSDHAEECAFVVEAEMGVGASHGKEPPLLVPYKHIQQQQQQQRRVCSAAAAFAALQQQQQPQQHVVLRAGGPSQDGAAPPSGRTSDPASTGHLPERRNSSVHAAAAPQQQQQLRLQFQPGAGVQIVQAATGQGARTSGGQQQPQMILKVLQQQLLQQQQLQPPPPQQLQPPPPQQLQPPPQQPRTSLAGQQLQLQEGQHHKHEQLVVQVQKPQQLASKQSSLQTSGPSGGAATPEVTAAKLHQAVEVWSKRLADSEAQKEAVKKLLEQATAHTKQLQQELQVAKQEKAALQEENAQYKSRAGAFDQELLKKDAAHGIQMYEALEKCKGLLGSSKNLEAQVDLSSKTLATKEKEVHKLSAELQAARARADRLAAELATSKQVAEQAHKAITAQLVSEAQARQEQLVLELETVKARCQQLEAQQVAPAGAAAAAAAAVGQPAAVAGAVKAEPQETLQHACEPAATLPQAVAAAHAVAAAAAAEAQLAAANARAGQLELQVAAAQQQLGSMSAELAAVKCQAPAAPEPETAAVSAQLQAALAAAQARVEELEAENVLLVSSSKAAIKQAQEECLQHSRAAQEAQAAAAALRQQLATQQEQQAEVAKRHSQVVKLQMAQEHAAVVTGLQWLLAQLVTQDPAVSQLLQLLSDLQSAQQAAQEWERRLTAGCAALPDVGGLGMEGGAGEEGPEAVAARLSQLTSQAVSLLVAWRRAADSPRSGSVSPTAAAVGAASPTAAAAGAASATAGAAEKRGPGAASRLERVASGQSEQATGTPSPRSSLQTQGSGGAAGAAVGAAAAQASQQPSSPGAVQGGGAAHKRAEQLRFTGSGSFCSAASLSPRAVGAAVSPAHASDVPKGLPHDAERHRDAIDAGRGRGAEAGAHHSSRYSRSRSRSRSPPNARSMYSNQPGPAPHHPQSHHHLPIKQPAPATTPLQPAPQSTWRAPMPPTGAPHEGPHSPRSGHGPMAPVPSHHGPQQQAQRPRFLPPPPAWGPTGHSSAPRGPPPHPPGPPPRPSAPAALQGVPPPPPAPPPPPLPFPPHPAPPQHYSCA